MKILKVDSEDLLSVNYYIKIKFKERESSNFRILKERRTKRNHPEDSYARSEIDNHETIVLVDGKKVFKFTF